MEISDTIENLLKIHILNEYILKWLLETLILNVYILYCLMYQAMESYF